MVGRGDTAKVQLMDLRVPTHAIRCVDHHRWMRWHGRVPVEVRWQSSSRPNCNSWPRTAAFELRFSPWRRRSSRKFATPNRSVPPGLDFNEVGVEAEGIGDVDANAIGGVGQKSNSALHQIIAADGGQDDPGGAVPTIMPTTVSDLTRRYDSVRIGLVIVSDAEADATICVSHDLIVVNFYVSGCRCEAEVTNRHDAAAGTLTALRMPCPPREGL